MNSHKPDDTATSDKHRIHSGSIQNTYRIPTGEKADKFQNGDVLGILVVAKHCDITSQTYIMNETHQIKVLKLSLKIILRFI